MPKRQLRKPADEKAAKIRAKEGVEKHGAKYMEQHGMAPTAANKVIASRRTSQNKKDRRSER